MSEGPDDFDLERTRFRDEEETVVAPPPPEPRRSYLLLTLAVLAVIALAVLAVLFLVFRTPARPRAVQSAAPSTRATAATATPGPSAAALPALDESDAYVRRAAAGLSNSPDLARWLAQPGLVRTLTAVVANVAEGETPRPHLGFLAPKQRFRVKGAPGRRIVADPSGFAGYDRFADAVASVDAGVAASVYRPLEPLFDAAYRDLGHPEGGFRRGLERGITALLTVPVPPSDVELVPHAIGFRYADPRFENLTAAQKQFLRLGPRNVRLIQAKLREVQGALGTASTLPSVPER